MFAEGLRALDRGGRAVRPLERRRSDARSNVEFVSANPTGPLHVGHGRQAALGDAISSLLECDRLAASRASSTTTTPARRSRISRSSVQARVRELGGGDVAIPEGGYHGEYIRELAQRYVDEHPSDPNGDDLDAVRRFAVRELRKEQDLDLQAFGVKFDVVLPRVVALHRRPRRRDRRAR